MDNWTKEKFGGQVVTSRTVDLGELDLGVPKRIKAELSNVSDANVSVVGHTSSCKCLHLGSGRREMEPHENVEMEVAILPEKTGRFWHRVTYLLDAESQRSVSVDLVGLVREESGEAIDKN